METDMSKQMQSRRLLGAAIVVGALILAGCATDSEPATEEAGAQPIGLPMQAQAGPWTLDEVWPDELKETYEPEPGYNRAARSIFVLAGRWKADPNSSNGTAKPPKAWLQAQVDSTTSPINPMSGNKSDYPAEGTEARAEFQKLWAAMKEQSKGQNRLGTTDMAGKWVLTTDESGPTDALATPEKKAISDAILTL